MKGDNLAYHQQRAAVDVRTWLVLFILSSVAVFFITSQSGTLILFLSGWLMLMAAGYRRRMFRYLLYYGLLSAVIWGAVQMMMLIPGHALPVYFSTLGVYGRKFLLPLMYMMRVADVPTGAMLEALYRLRLPKSAGIAAAVLLRFLPTISHEYRMIRYAQKFRGLGVGVVNTIVHLPGWLSGVLLPLIVRTTRIADELSASAVVRGVRLSDGITSFWPVRIGCKDIVMMVVQGAVIVVVLGIEIWRSTL